MTHAKGGGPTDAQLVALAERLGLRVGHAPGQLNSLTTWEGMGAIQAAMAGLGYDFALFYESKNRLTKWEARFVSQDNRARGLGRGHEAPDAIVLAACAALGLDKEDTRD